MNTKSTNPDTLTPAQYREAFQTIHHRLTETQLAMLRAHYHAPDRKITAGAMAKAVGYPDHATANLQYGIIGSLLCEVLGQESGSDRLFVLAHFIQPHTESNEEWLWQMRAPVAQALQELGWIANSHALPASADYVAYHSSELMGQEYWPTESFNFFSRKAESFLRRAIGCRVWVVVSVRDDSHMAYRLAGVFTPSQVRAEGDGFGIIGAGTPFRPPFEVTAVPWFAELLREQNRFSYGFNPIRSESVRAELHRLLAGYGGESVLNTDEVAVPSQFFEGATRQVFINRYERNPDARRHCIAHYGCRCSVCGFDFEEAYGDLGRGFIHVHHLKPLSEIQELYEIDPIADLRPICPNCHAIIHRRAEMMTVEDLKELIQRPVRTDR